MSTPSSKPHDRACACMQCLREFDALYASTGAAPEAPDSEQQSVKWTADEIADACVKAGLGILECNALIVTLKCIPAATQQAGAALTWTQSDNLRRTLNNIKDATRLADVRSLANLGLGFIDAPPAATTASTDKGEKA